MIEYPNTPRPREDHYAGGVYAIVHDATGWCYVGAAVRFDRRWNRHIRDLDYGMHPCAPLQRIWDTEGPEALTFNILEFVRPTVPEWLTIDQVLPVERQWIDHYRRMGTCYNSPEHPTENPISIAVTVPLVVKASLEEWAAEEKISRGHLLRTILRDALKSRRGKG